MIRQLDDYPDEPAKIGRSSILAIVLVRLKIYENVSTLR